MTKRSDDTIRWKRIESRRQVSVTVEEEDIHEQVEIMAKETVEM